MFAGREMGGAKIKVPGGQGGGKKGGEKANQTTWGKKRDNEQGPGLEKVPGKGPNKSRCAERLLREKPKKGENGF